MADLELQPAVFDDLFTSRNPFTMGGQRHGQRGHRSGDCVTVDRMYNGGRRPGRPERATRAAKSIIPMNFPGQTLAAQGLGRLGATHTRISDRSTREIAGKSLRSSFISHTI